MEQHEGPGFTRALLSEAKLDFIEYI